MNKSHQEFFVKLSELLEKHDLDMDVKFDYDKSRDVILFYFNKNEHYTALNSGDIEQLAKGISENE